MQTNREMNEKQNTNTVLGILAHVDAGKTTLAEGLLYTAGALRKQGRVDHGDTLLDSHELEKSRGITIFSSQAHFEAEGRRFTLLDTPGHVDFSAEMERTLSVLDAAILVISGTDGVQAHTRTLWRLLAFYAVPTFLFVTKMDYARFSREKLMRELTEEFGEELVNFSAPAEERDDCCAMLGEEAMQEFLETGKVSDTAICGLIRERALFPCFFGSGLKLEGLNEFLDGVCRFTEMRQYPKRFSARVFKITHDASGNRIALMKLTGGMLKARDVLKERTVEEKVSQIRLVNGEKQIPLEEAHAGDVVAVTGLTETTSGDELGNGESRPPVLEPVMRYAVALEEGVDPLNVLPLLRQLEEEDPMLRVTWNAGLHEIQVGLMGAIQAEILKSIVLERFGLAIGLVRGHVMYRETIADTVEGVGHFEPLRHYAEVHLLLEPLPRGSGLVIGADLSEDVLDRNWQRLILTHLSEKQHIGVLTGSPVTDMKITLVGGRAHLKHTEGGDFRQATYRAVRQGLMQAKSVLLEPYYRFRISAPQSASSRVMSDVRSRGCTLLPPVYEDGEVLISGRGPVSGLIDYQMELTSCTGGTGHIVTEQDGYDVCGGQEQVVREMHYVPEADVDNPPGSVFCAHGVGFLVPWDHVKEYMHVESCLGKRNAAIGMPRAPKVHRVVPDSELEEIMLREFGPIRRKQYGNRRAPNAAPEHVEVQAPRDYMLIVDGYNVIFAWEELRELAERDIASAREKLLQVLSNYSAFRQCATVLVFDGYRVPGNRGEQFDYRDVHVVYTKEKESGDLYIEKLIGRVSGKADVRLVTSDGMIQLSALRKGVTRISAGEFELVVGAAEEEITEIISGRHLEGKSRIGELLKKFGIDDLSAPGES